MIETIGVEDLNMQGIRIYEEDTAIACNLLANSLFEATTVTVNCK